MIFNLIDCGANGNLPLPLNKNMFNDILRFDPKFEKESDNIKPYCLSDIDGTVEVNMTSGGGFDCLKVNRDYIRDVLSKLNRSKSEQMLKNSEIKSTKTYNCVRLDTFLDSNHSFNFIKLDTQGMEGRILRGAENFLKTSCDYIFVELFNRPMFIDFETKDEVVSYLNTLGFNVIWESSNQGSFGCCQDVLLSKLDDNDVVKKMLNI